MLDLGGTNLLLLAGALLFAGALTGILAGLFGLGGGAIIVPVLYELFGVIGIPAEIRMPLCVGTSLAIIAPTSVRSFLAHRAKGAVDIDIIKLWAIPVVVGVIAGSIIARYASADVFKAVFVLVALTSAIRLLFGRDSWRISETLPAKSVMRLVGLMIGVLSSLMGIGGGQLSNLFLLLYGRPIHNAIATSSGLGVLIAIPGLVGYMLAGLPRVAQYPTIAALHFPWTIGFVSLIGFVAFLPTTVLTASLGARLAHALPKRLLEISFGLFLLLVSARFVLSFAQSS